jgi:hypothetical protein
VALGCADGAQLAALHPAFDIIAFDRRERIEECRVAHGVGMWLEFDLNGDEPLPLDDFAGSVIVASGVIERVTSPEAFVRRLRMAVDAGADAVVLSSERNAEDLGALLSSGELHGHTGKTRAHDYPGTPFETFVVVPGREQKLAAAAWWSNRERWETRIAEQEQRIASQRKWLDDATRVNNLLKAQLQQRSVHKSTLAGTVRQHLEGTVDRLALAVQQSPRRLSSVNTIVFSRDRAMQLDAFIRSVRRFAPGLMPNLSIVYAATAEDFRKGYEVLQREASDVYWRSEDDFRSDVRALVGTHDYVVFNTDDDLYYKRTDRFYLDEETACFSFRLGLNTVYCYPLDQEERVSEPELHRTWFAWRWVDQSVGTLGYPLALNGHVFRANELKEWLYEIEFSNPNELESALQQFLIETRPKIAAFRHSRLVNVPANLVNETHPNRNWGVYTLDELNKRFLAGERIEIEAMDFAHVHAAHEEIPYVFRPSAGQATA